jgi:hypothetical protein
MKWLICALLTCSAFTWAEEDADQTAIQRVIDALNIYKSSGNQRALDLFTNDAGGEFARLLELDRWLAPTNAPWTEVTKPVLTVRSTRFITTVVALVDAANTQYGSIIVKREIPLLLVMKKEAGVWRIAALRIGLDVGIWTRSV